MSVLSVSSRLPVGLCAALTLAVCAHGEPPLPRSAPPLGFSDAYDVLWEEPLFEEVAAAGSPRGASDATPAWKQHGTAKVVVGNRGNVVAVLTRGQEVVYYPQERVAAADGGAGFERAFHQFIIDLPLGRPTVIAVAAEAPILAVGTDAGVVYVYECQAARTPQKLYTLALPASAVGVERVGWAGVLQSSGVVTSLSLSGAGNCIAVGHDWFVSVYTATTSYPSSTEDGPTMRRGPLPVKNPQPDTLSFAHHGDETGAVPAGVRSVHMSPSAADVVVRTEDGVTHRLRLEAPPPNPHRPYANAPANKYLWSIQCDLKYYLKGVDYETIDANDVEGCSEKCLANRGCTGAQWSTSGCVLWHNENCHSKRSAGLSFAERGYLLFTVREDALRIVRTTKPDDTVLACGFGADAAAVRRALRAADRPLPSCVPQSPLPGGIRGGAARLRVADAAAAVTPLALQADAGEMTPAATVLAELTPLIEAAMLYQVRPPRSIAARRVWDAVAPGRVAGVAAAASRSEVVTVGQPVAEMHANGELTVTVPLRVSTVSEDTGRLSTHTALQESPVAFVVPREAAQRVVEVWEQEAEEEEAPDREPLERLLAADTAAWADAGVCRVRKACGAAPSSCNDRLEWAVDTLELWQEGAPMPNTTSGGNETDSDLRYDICPPVDTWDLAARSKDGSTENKTAASGEERYCGVVQGTGWHSRTRGPGEFRCLPPPETLPEGSVCRDFTSGADAAHLCEPGTECVAKRSAVSGGADVAVCSSRRRMHTVAVTGRPRATLDVEAHVAVSGEGRAVAVVLSFNGVESYTKLFVHKPSAGYLEDAIGSSSGTKAHLPCAHASSSGMAEAYDCRDGSWCTGRRCCNERSGVLRCPPHAPSLCASATCGEDCERDGLEDSIGCNKRDLLTSVAGRMYLTFPQQFREVLYGNAADEAGSSCPPGYSPVRSYTDCRVAASPHPVSVERHTDRPSCYFTPYGKAVYNSAGNSFGPGAVTVDVVCKAMDYLILHSPGVRCCTTFMVDVQAERGCMDAAEAMRRRAEGTQTFRWAGLVEHASTLNVTHDLPPGCFATPSGDVYYNPLKSPARAHRSCRRSAGGLLRSICSIRRQDVEQQHLPEPNGPGHQSDTRSRLLVYPSATVYACVFGALGIVTWVTLILAVRRRLRRRTLAEARARDAASEDEPLTKERAEELRRVYVGHLEKLRCETEEDAGQCSVCLDELSGAACVRLPTCGHVLHLGCMRDYVVHLVEKRRKRNPRCPNCRASITPDDEDPASASGAGGGLAAEGGEMETVSSGSDRSAPAAESEPQPEAEPEAAEDEHLLDPPRQPLRSTATEHVLLRRHSVTSVRSAPLHESRIGSFSSIPPRRRSGVLHESMNSLASLDSSAAAHRAHPTARARAVNPLDADASSSYVMLE
eukprot:Rhum_TRINITY_DN23019_c0_g1::Rhum_TRINITY_DN23019_c0_g1_i1::g.176909::m.176909